MRAMVDTSTLWKKYFEEEGSDRFVSVLEKATAVIVSPVTWLEFNSIVHRRLAEKTIKAEDVEWIKKEAREDFNCFHVVMWNENMEKKGVELIVKYQLRSLDSIQLASAVCSESDVFVTSDKKLSTIARKESKEVLFI